MNQETKAPQPAQITPAKGNRSPNYPALSLKAAIDKARIVYEKEKRNPALDTVIYGHWEYAPKSSGARSTFSALLKFGLLEEIESQNGREVKLSVNALKILIGEDTERKAALKEAALAPQIFKKLWEKYGVSLPSDESLKSRLILDYGFNDIAVRDFIKDYKATIEYAGLTNEDNSATNDQGNGTEDKTKENPAGGTPSPSGKKPDPAKLPVNPAVREHKETLSNMLATFKMPLGLSEVELIFTGSKLEPADFDALTDYIGLFKKQYERKLAAKRLSDDDDDDVDSAIHSGVDDKGR